MQQEVTLAKKSCSKYGVLSMIGWNIFIGLLILTSKISIDNILASSNLQLTGAGFLLLLWSVIWYFFGYQYRKRYLLKKDTYKEKLPKADRKNFDHTYFTYKLSKFSKTASTILLITIPWYLLGVVQGNTMHTNDYLIVGAIALIAAVFYNIHKKYRDPF